MKWMGEIVPELPEVEAVRIGLEKLVLGRRIDDIHIYWPRIIQTDKDLQAWVLELKGQTICQVQRRGKYLIFVLDQLNLVSHLRMEGKYHFYLEEDLPEARDKHSHVIFKFTDGSQLHYNDVRKFGRMALVGLDDLETYFQAKSLGPEPLTDDFSLVDFLVGLGQSQRQIKPLLLDQKLVVGLGNIYVDEALFRAGIHPIRQASTLSEAEGEALYQSIRQVLAEAVQLGGSTIRTYLNSLGEAGKFQQALQVYGRTGQACIRCGHPIEKIKVGQRGTHYCPQCQSLGGSK